MSDIKASPSHHVFIWSLNRTRHHEGRIDAPIGRLQERLSSANDWGNGNGFLCFLIGARPHDGAIS